MRATSLHRASLFTLLLSALGVAACGGSGDESSSSVEPSTGGETGQGGKAGASPGKGGAAGVAGAATGKGGAAAGGAAAGGAATGGASGGAAAGGASTGGASAGGASGKGGQAGAAGAAGKGGAAGGAGGGAGAGQGGAGAAGAAGAAGQGGSAGGCAADCDGVCLGGVCCDPLKACADVCCGGDAICSFNKCVDPGAPCVDPSDCAETEYCEPLLGDPVGSGGSGGGAMCVLLPAPSGRCLPRPPTCPDGAPPDPNASCVSKCEWKPPVSAFDPVVTYSWGGVPSSTDVMMQPIVVQLDDDDCDGKVTARDIPEIVFATFEGGKYYGPGALHVVSIVGGQVVEKLTLPGAVQASSGLAAGDLDGDGVPEIVACAPPAPGGLSCCDAQAQNTGVRVFRADGSIMWEQLDTTNVHCGYDMPSIADPMGTGKPMVLVGLTLLDGQNGDVVKNLDPASTYGVKATSFADVDGDGQLDVVEGRRAFRVDGTPIWDLATVADPLPWGYHAVGDLDRDGKPEVAIISSSNHTAQIISHDPSSASGAKIVRAGIDINNGISTAAFCGASSEYGGGPPTIADFDGDGLPDVGVAGAVGYIVLSGAKLMDPSVAAADTVLWFKETHDCSSAVTGSSVFDFNGDGQAEVVYSDEYHLWVYDGKTGNSLIPETCNTTGTLWEYPVVADVDGDSQADIVVASNGYAVSCNGTKQSGIRVFGSATKSWVRTRRIWNQHTYHVTNVNEDGSIPVNEVSNWLVPGLDNFRQNKQPGAEFAAPDAVVVQLLPRCKGAYGLVARVRNVGEAVLPAGVPVGFYKGTPPTGTLLGIGATTQALYPLQAEDVVIDVPGGDDELSGGFAKAYAVVDDGAEHPDWKECRSDNNTSEAVTVGCGKL